MKLWSIKSPDLPSLVKIRSLESNRYIREMYTFETSFVNFFLYSSSRPHIKPHNRNSRLIWLKRHGMEVDRSAFGEEGHKNKKFHLKLYFSLPKSPNFPLIWLGVRTCINIIRHILRKDHRTDISYTSSRMACEQEKEFWQKLRVRRIKGVQIHIKLLQTVKSAYMT